MGWFRSSMVLVFVVGSGCAGEEGAQLDGGADVGPGPVSAAYSGQWTGVTAQGLDIGFAVNEEGVTLLDLNWAIGDCRWQVSFHFPEPAHIQGERFVTSIDMNDGRLTTEVTISFETQSRAEGSLSYEVGAVPGAGACWGIGLTTFAATKA